MYFCKIGQNRYRVYKKKDENKFYGVIEKHEYTSIDMATGKRSIRSFWQIYYVPGEGWKKVAKRKFDTREEAADFLIKEINTPYNDRRMHWTKRAGE